MNKSIIAFLTLLLSLASFDGATRPMDPITFYLEDEPIYTSSNLLPPGFLLELSAEVMKIIDIQPDIHSPLGNALKTL